MKQVDRGWEHELMGGKVGVEMERKRKKRDILIKEDIMELGKNLMPGKLSGNHNDVFN